MLESSTSLDALPEADATVVVDDVQRRLGGPAINMAAHLVSLGDRVRLGGVMGRWDEPMLRDLLARVRLDPSDLAWVEGSSDLLFYFKTDLHYGAAYQRAPLPADLGARYGRLANASSGILLLAGSRHAAMRRIFADIVQTSPAPWKVFAPNYAVHLFDGEELARILPWVNLVSLNEAEAAAVVHRLGLADIADLRHRTRAAILLTRAGRGARLLLDNARLELPPLSGRSGDVIGAGDAFLSGMLHGILHGEAPAQAAALGSQAAAAFVRGSSWPLLGQCAEFAPTLRGIR
jgi:sugar/nucleoside kinase (ribokinase family)